MELLCPECMGTLHVLPDNKVRCAMHGGQYRLLFLRSVPLPARAMPDAAPAVGVTPVTGQVSPSEIAASPPLEVQQGTATCRFHIGAPSQYRCVGCGADICRTCAFPQSDGTAICPQCALSGHAAAGPIAAAAPPLVAPGTKCRFHDTADATTVCRVCGAPVCATCAFAFPGNVHVCPNCATNRPKNLGAKRKNLLTWAYVLAVWSTLGIVVMLSGVLAETVQTESDLAALGMAISLFVILPALVGVGLSFACLERNLGNPASVWGAVVWNCLTMGVLLLMVVAGMFLG